MTQNVFRRALLSVTDKSELDFLGPALVSLGYELVSTGGTADKLRSMHLPVTSVEEVTAFPEMMDGRLKTLHPNIFGGILARANHKGDLEALANHGIDLFDVVVVNLYAFEKQASDKSKPFDDLVEHIDIGGPSLLRAAAKNWRRVYVVPSPMFYAALIASLRHQAQFSSDAYLLRHAFATQTFAHTAHYDNAIADEFKASVYVAGQVKRGVVL